MGWSQRQFAEAAERLAKGAARRPSGAQPVAGTPSRFQLPDGCVILGIDPSLRGTGWGAVQCWRSNQTSLGFGTIHCPKEWLRTQCLAAITRGIRGVMAIHPPVACVVEGLFYAQNLRTTLIMGEARGAALAAVAEAGIPIYEIAPRRVKQAIVGYGAAQKLAVARMIQRILQLESAPPPDAADALALAVTFTHEIRRVTGHSLNQL